MTSFKFLVSCCLCFLLLLLNMLRGQGRSIKLSGERARVHRHRHHWPKHIVDGVTEEWPAHFYHMGMHKQKTQGTYEQRRIRTCGVDGDSCPYVNPDALRSSKQAPSSRSISPWVMTENYNRHRFPALIYEACCVCHNCVNYTNNTPMENLYSTKISLQFTVGIFNSTGYFLVKQQVAIARRSYNCVKCVCYEGSGAHVYVCYEDNGAHVYT